MTYFRIIACTALAVVLRVVPVLAQGTTPAEIAKLGDADLKKFLKIEQAVTLSNGDDESFNEIQASIKQFLDTNPDFVPMQVEAVRLQWKRLATGFGDVRSSQSVLTAFLEYEKLAPKYGKTYRMAALAYVLANDYEGAKPALKKAAELEPDEPWVDVIWGRFYERQQDRAKAINAARKALSKAGDDKIVVVEAIAMIADNHGLLNERDVQDVIRQASIGRDSQTLTKVASGLVDRYSFQPGLIEVSAGLLKEAMKLPDADRPEIDLQWALMTITGGRLYRQGGSWEIDPAYLAATKETLVGLQGVPKLDERVWSLHFDVAMSEHDLVEADRLITLGKTNRYSEKLVGRKEATLRFARKEFREAAVIYEQLKLPKDGLYWDIQERLGNRDIVRTHRFRMVEDNPTDPYVLGEYADFMLYNYKDSAQAIEYGERAIALAPYPVALQTVATAYLLSSGTSLRYGHLDEALASFEKAKKIGFDENYLMRYCWDFCPEIQASLRAFR